MASLEVMEDFLTQATTGTIMAVHRAINLPLADMGHDPRVMLCFLKYLNDCWHRYHQRKDDYVCKTFDSLFQHGRIRGTVCLLNWCKAIGEQVFASTAEFKDHTPSGALSETGKKLDYMLPAIDWARLQIKFDRSLAKLSVPTSDAATGGVYTIMKRAIISNLLRHRLHTILQAIHPMMHCVAGDEKCTSKIYERDKDLFIIGVEEH